MEETNNEMSAQRSLEIITDSINQSRLEAGKTTSKHLLLWGGLVLTTSLIVGGLWIHTASASWNFLWFVMTIVGFIAEYFLNRKEEKHAATLVGSMIGASWLLFCFFAIGICVALTIALIFAPPVGYRIPLTGLLALLMGMATAFTGFLLKKNFVVFLGIVMGILGLFLDFYIDGGYEMLIIAGMSVFGHLIPALIIKGGE